MAPSSRRSSLAERGILPDLITVAEDLRAREALEGCGGASYLSTLSSASFTSANVEYYAKIVHDLARERKAQALAEDLRGGRLELSDFIDQIGSLKNGQGKTREIRVLGVAEILQYPPVEYVIEPYLPREPWST